MDDDALEFLVKAEADLMLFQAGRAAQDAQDAQDARAARDAFRTPSKEPSSTVLDSEDPKSTPDVPQSDASADKEAVEASAVDTNTAAPVKNPNSKKSNFRPPAPVGDKTLPHQDKAKNKKPKGKKTSSKAPKDEGEVGDDRNVLANGATTKPAHPTCPSPQDTEPSNPTMDVSPVAETEDSTADVGPAFPQPDRPARSRPSRAAGKAASEKAAKTAREEAINHADEEASSPAHQPVIRSAPKTSKTNGETTPPKPVAVASAEPPTDTSANESSSAALPPSSPPHIIAPSSEPSLPLGQEPLATANPPGEPSTVESANQCSLRAHRAPHKVSRIEG